MTTAQRLTEQEMLQYLLPAPTARNVVRLAYHSRISCTTLYRIKAGERVGKRIYRKLLRLYQERVS